MIYVGIDVAKLNHFASAISSDGEIRLNLQMTLMASSYFPPSLTPWIVTASSSVLSQRHTTVTTLFDTLLLSFTKCVC